MKDLTHAKFFDDKFLERLDENHNLIGFINGVYDLNKDINDNPFRPGRPEDNISMSTNNKYIEYSFRFTRCFSKWHD